MDDFLKMVVENLRGAAEDLKAEQAADQAAGNPPFRLILSFRLSKAFTDDVERFIFQYLGRDVEIKAGKKGQNIKGSYDLVATSLGFASKQDAEHFGESLDQAFTYAAIEAKSGIAIEIKPSSSGWGQHIIEALRSELGVELATAPPGIFVYDNTTPHIFPKISITATVTQSCSTFIDFAQQIEGAGKKLSNEHIHALRLLSASRMATDPIAKLVLSVAAVEYLGQDLEWSKEQKSSLKNIISQAASDIELPPLEKSEIIDAISKIHRLSLRQGVKRLMNKLGLNELFAEWDELYAPRSEAVHGTRRLDDAELAALAERSADLARTVLYTAVGWPMSSRTSHDPISLGPTNGS